MSLGYATGDRSDDNDGTTTSPGTSTFCIRVIRTVGATPQRLHSTNKKIRYRNIPKWFGHINETRFKETDFPEEIDLWVENFHRADTSLKEMLYCFCSYIGYFFCCC